MTNSESKHHSLNIRNVDFLPWLVLTISIIVTIIVWQDYNNYVYESAKIEFEKESQRIVDKIEKRMAHYAEILQAARGLFATDDDVDRDEWNQFISTQKIQERFPGIQGVGFQKRTNDSDVFYKDMDELRRLGLLNREPPSIHSDGYYRYIFYLEPVNERNKQAYGYDMYSEPIRREALERSRDFDTPALSGKVKLVQEITQKKQAGFLLYLPVYKNGMQHMTTAERNSALIGNVYEPFRTGDFMDGIVTEKIESVDFHIYDNIVSDDALLFDYNLEHKYRDEPIFTKNILITNYGRTWILSFTGYSGLIPYTNIVITNTILVTGLTLSVFNFFISRQLRIINKTKHEQKLTSKFAELKLRSEIENLENINKLKTEFVSVISHELKTPLVSIQGYAEMLDMELKDITKDQRDEINEISKNAIMLNTIINDLLDTQKLDLHKIELHKSQIDIYELVQNVLSGFKPVFDKKSIRIEVSIPKHTVIYVDESRLIQVLNNLIKNAIEAITHDHGMISLSVKNESGDTVFSITDNGVGMSDAQLSGLFNKFYQTNTSLARKKGGSGLGLYISRELISLHGGTMWVESKLGNGSTFYFTIPS